MTCTLEVCVDNEHGLDAAIRGGADRIELCSALPLGGLTPSVGLLRAAAQAPIPIYAMIRPRAGDFCFSSGEIRQMLHDIDAVRQAGLAGVVLGATQRTSPHNYVLDQETLRQLIAHASDLNCSLHRAFDVLHDFTEGLDVAIALGFERILTSGCTPTAMAGMFRLRELVQRAQGRIEIMAGSGIRTDNVQTIIRQTGVTAVHASCRGPRSEPVDPQLIEFGFCEAEPKETRISLVHQLAALVHP
jgi:copper homeostasis protein